MTEEEISIVEGRGGRGATALPVGGETAAKPSRRRVARFPAAALEALHSDDDEELE